MTNSGILDSSGYFNISESGYYKVFFTGMGTTSNGGPLYMAFYKTSGGRLASGLEIHVTDDNYTSGTIDDTLYIAAGTTIYFAYGSASTSYRQLHGGYGRISVMSMYQ
jgi:hypothetical protein